MRALGIFSTYKQNPADDKLMLKRFLSIEKKLVQKGIEIPFKSIASSDAILNKSSGWLNLVRPGICLYGIYPETKDLTSKVDLKQVLSFKARLEHVKTIKRGESVTYGGKFIAPQSMKIGTIHAGFYDGIPQELSNLGTVSINGVNKSIIGSISLNHLLIDLNGMEVKKGSIVEIISKNGENQIKKISDSSGWMTYNLLNHLNQNTPRVYIRNGNPVALLDVNS